MQTLADKEKQYNWPEVAHEKAQAACLPSHSGDGYAFGGGAIVVIGVFAISVGEGAREYALAEEIARRWNHVANVCDHKWGDVIRLPQGGASAVCQKCGLVSKTERNV